MVENTRTAEKQDQQAGSAAPAGQYEAADSPRAPAPKMEGFFNRHTSGYWAVMIPALSVRYLFEAVMKLGSARAVLTNKSKAQKKEIGDKLDTAYGLATGVAMMGVTTFYANKTYHDIKSVFAESVGWETGKRPQDVGFLDILRSDNTLVQAAKRNFLKYNFRRYAVNAPFFGKQLFKGIISGDAAVGVGVATNSVYLMSDVFTRKETFFERLQSFVEEKIQHTDHLGDKITAIDLINLYETHSRDKNHKHKFSGRMDTQEWHDRVKVFGRIADIMNQTYGNEPKKENVNFTLSEMIYLMGHGMINSSNPERSCAFIEVAAHNGIDAVKDVASHSTVDRADVKYAQARYLSKIMQPSAQEDVKEPQIPAMATRFAPDAGLSNVDKVLTQRAAANDAEYAQMQRA